MKYASRLLSAARHRAIPRILEIWLDRLTTIVETARCPAPSLILRSS
jgi:hypothetical protein